MTSSRTPTRDEGKNRFLNALPRDEYKEFFTYLKPVSLLLDQVIIRPDEPVQYLHFPERAVLGNIAIMNDGASIELSTIGQEGLAGLAAILGDGIETNLVLVDIAGPAQRIEAGVVRDEFRRGGILQALILRYSQALLMQTAQVSACNRHHRLDKRLVRLLLMLCAQLGTNDLPITQGMLAFKLGTHRPDITKAIGALQRAGLVVYKRGQLTILDEQGLEQNSCECFSIIRNSYARLLPPHHI